MSDQSIAPGEAIALWREHQLSASALLRALIEHDTWEIALNESAVADALANNSMPVFDLFTDSAGQQQLFVFEDKQAHDVFCETVGKGPGHMLSLPGYALFQTDLSTVGAITINPLTVNTLTLTRDYFERLSHLGAAVHIERALLALRQGRAQDGDVSRVKHFERYWLALQDLGEDADPPRGIALAPDDQGRRLAALFTAEDAFDAFAEWWATTHQPGDLKVTILTGEALFTALARQNLDGLVFNCEGPTVSVAFGIGMAQVVLDEP